MSPVAAWTSGAAGALPGAGCEVASCWREPRTAGSEKEERGADGQQQRCRDRGEDVRTTRRRCGGRRLTEPAFLPEPASDLQPHPIRHDRSIERPREIPDALEVLKQRAALLALIEVDLELRSTDRSQRAVDQLLNRVCVSWAGHTRVRPVTRQRPASNVAQAHTRLVHLGLRRPFSDPENLGDLLVLQAFDVVQHERRPASLRQLSERALEIHLAHRPLRQAAAARIRNPGLVVQRVGDLAAARRAAPQIVEAQIRGQPIEPRSERGVAAKRIELPVRRQEDVLQEIFRIGRVAEHPGGQAEQPAGVRAVQLLERARIALRAPLHERPVVIPAGLSRAPAGRGMNCDLRRCHAGVALPAIHSHSFTWGVCGWFAALPAGALPDPAFAWLWQGSPERSRSRPSGAPAKSRIVDPTTRTPSALSRPRLSSRFPPYPPRRPAAAITRWHGTSWARQLRITLPTARWASGLPAAAATSP